ncbi:glucose-1-phosphate adenylyltransferase [Striga asiatica]|uniref:Glucose-1-phosphate adenylyltransferase n=1 Tax=Striga asiatica TaxID=4170 RepID=A0A5A7Q6L5_STRAF|nr:glucose-1-phosphate adenylyltransferase [Striga asiatica]
MVRTSSRTASIHPHCPTFCQTRRTTAILPIFGEQTDCSRVFLVIIPNCLNPKKTVKVLLPYWDFRIDLTTHELILINVIRTNNSQVEHFHLINSFGTSMASTRQRRRHHNRWGRIEQDLVGGLKTFIDWGIFVWKDLDYA